MFVLIYGKTVVNRLKLKEFEIIILKHTSYKTLVDKKSRRHKWLDLAASFKIQSMKFHASDHCKTIGKRELKQILDVTDLSIDFNLSSFMTDLRRNDKYTNRIHMLLLDDPLISNKRLYVDGLNKSNSTISMEDRLLMEKRRFDLFQKKLLQEDQLYDVDHHNDSSDDGCDNFEEVEEINKAKKVEGNRKIVKESEISLKVAFHTMAVNQTIKAADRAIRMAEKASARQKLIKHDEERRLRLSQYLAVNLEKEKLEKEKYNEDNQSLKAFGILNKNKSNKQRLAPLRLYKSIDEKNIMGGNDVTDLLNDTTDLVQNHDNLMKISSNLPEISSRNENMENKSHHVYVTHQDIPIPSITSPNELSYTTDHAFYTSTNIGDTTIDMGMNEGIKTVIDESNNPNPSDLMMERIRQDIVEKLNIHKEIRRQEKEEEKQRVMRLVKEKLISRNDKLAAIIK